MEGQEDTTMPQTKITENEKTRKKVGVRHVSDDSW